MNTIYKKNTFLVHKPESFKNTYRDGFFTNVWVTTDPVAVLIRRKQIKIVCSVKTGGTKKRFLFNRR